MNKQISGSTSSAFVWVICTISLLCCGLVLLVLRQAASLPDIAALVAVLVGFVSLVFLYYLFGTPVTAVSIEENGDVTFTWRYLIYRRRKTFPARSIAEPTIDEKIDSDGDSHWSVKLVLPDGSIFMLAEYGARTGSGKNERNRQRCEAKRAQFRQAALSF